MSSEELYNDSRDLIAFESESGDDVLYAPYFRCELEEFGHSYMFFAPVGALEGELVEIRVFIIEPSKDSETDDYELIEVEDELELQKLDEVLKAFEEDMESEE